jgi:Domain of unknown function (DUF4340)
MRGVRTFILLLVIGIPLVWFAARDYADPAGRTDSDDKHEKVFAVEADKIEEISIKSASGERTTLKKTGTDWQIVAPVAASPDTAEVSGLTSNLSTVEMQRVIEDNASDLKEYGLAQPRVEVSFKADGKQQTLQIGEKTPPGTDLYAKLADQNKVFLISSFLDSTFNKTTFDLRDKAALKLDRDKIDALEIATADRQLRFAKVDGEWRMTAPATGRTDYTAVESLIGRLGSVQMKSIVAAEAADLAQYGLDKPASTVRIGSGSSQAALLIGKAATEGNVYAKDQSRPAVFTLESSLVDELKKEAGEYRQKDLFDARGFNTTRVEIARGGQTVAFEKSKVKDKDGKEEEKWKQVAPVAKDVDGAKVESLLTAITGARADSFVADAAAQPAKTGLDKPELTVTLKFDDGKKEERVAFGRSGADGFASRAGEPGAAKIAVSTIDSVVKALEGLK